MEDKESLRKSISPVGPPVTATAVTPSSPLHNTSEPTVAEIPFIATTNAPPSSSTAGSDNSLHPISAPSPQLLFQANDQLLRVLTERSGHWFSLLPRSPCDLASLATSPPGASRVSPQASSTPARPKSPSLSPALPLTPSAASASASPHHPAGLLSYPLSALQVRTHRTLNTRTITGFILGPTFSPNYLVITQKLICRNLYGVHFETDFNVHLCESKFTISLITLT